MSELNRVDTTLLEVIAGMKDGKAEGAFNIRKDSGCAGRVNTENVTITTKTDKPGIDIRFVPGCKDSCHIPVIITESGLRETVYNDFYVGSGADVVIAGNGRNTITLTSGRNILIVGNGDGNRVTVRGTVKSTNSKLRGIL